MSRTRIMTLGLALMVGSLASTGCDDSRYGRVSLRQRRSTPESELGPGGIVVTAGGVLVFEAEPRAAEGSREYVGFERFELRSFDARIAEVRRSILRDTWVVNGVSTGTTELDVLVDGDVVDQIPVEVIVGSATEVGP